MGGMCTLSSTKPQNKKSVDVKFGDLGGQGMILTVETKEHRETCHSVALFTTNTTWTGLVVNLGLCSERPENNHLSHSTE
jgi:hypothetical protein